jgi:hypothetical protein
VRVLDSGFPVGSCDGLTETKTLLLGARLSWQGSMTTSAVVLIPPKSRNLRGACLDAYLEVRLG